MIPAFIAIKVLNGDGPGPGPHGGTSDALVQIADYAAHIFDSCRFAVQVLGTVIYGSRLGMAYVDAVGGVLSHRFQDIYDEPETLVRLIRALCYNLDPVQLLQRRSQRAASTTVQSIYASLSRKV